MIGVIGGETSLWVGRSMQPHGRSDSFMTLESGDDAHTFGPECKPMDSAPHPPEAKHDPAVVGAAFARWMERRNRRNEDPAYMDEWWAQQCGSCQFWIPLSESLGYDYGACAQETSPFDGTVRFEHDGREAFSLTDGWGQPDAMPHAKG